MNKTGADKLSRYLAGLTITQGAGAGEPFRLLPWQRRFIRGAWSVEGDAALSVARGNGKSALVAGIACAYLDGPLRQPRSEVVCVASSFAQGRIIYEHVCAFLRERGHDLSDRDTWRRQDSANFATLEAVDIGARIRCVGSDPRRMHGLAPILVLADEPAQWLHTVRDAALAALRTAMGKLEGSRLIALGTRSDDPEHWFSRMLDGHCDYAQCHAAGEDDPPFQVRTWRKANPSLSIMPALERRIRKEAKEAKADASLLHSFKALRLNQGVSDVAQATLLEAGTWKRITGDVPRDGRPVWGIDLGTSAAMSAVSAYWPTTGRLESLAAFPSTPRLSTRGLGDGVGNLYVRMQERGELIQTGGEAVDISDLIKAAWQAFGAPSAIAADRWRIPELRDALQKVRLPRCPLQERGQGFKDGAEDVRAFRRACLEGKVAPVESLLLTAAMAAARTTSDPAGNAKLAKMSEGGRRQRARDDAAAAAILAVALGARRTQVPPRQGWRYSGMAG